jgi:AcrR family transcriptional regulator
MKVSKTQAAENRAGIVDAAARLYREKGLDGVGVAEITRDAGLTHGGLYRHFESKDALAREACLRAFEWTITPLDALEHTGSARRTTSVLWFMGICQPATAINPAKAARQPPWPRTQRVPAPRCLKCLPKG